MTPKEKAEYLVNKFHHKMPAQVIPTASTYVGQLSCDIDLMGYFENAKLCALIAVDEVIEALHEHHWQNRLIIDYWEEVKEELKQL
jgi:hypothetical protein